MAGKTGLLLVSFFILLFTHRVLAIDPIGHPVHRLVKWSEPVTKSLQGSAPVKVLHFEGSVYDVNDIPLYMERFPVANASAKPRAEITGVQYQPLKEGALIKNTNKIGKDLNVKAEIVISKKNAFVQISFIPIRKASTGVYEKVVSFDVTVFLEYSGSSSSKRVEMRYYSPNSVLATGSWYRIGVVNDGIYKLTYQNLKDLGMNVDAINPRNLRIYGNGGGMLPFKLPMFSGMMTCRKTLFYFRVEATENLMLPTMFFFMERARHAGLIMLVMVIITTRLTGILTQRIILLLPILGQAKEFNQIHPAMPLPHQLSPLLMIMPIMNWMQLTGLNQEDNGTGKYLMRLTTLITFNLVSLTMWIHYMYCQTHGHAR